MLNGAQEKNSNLQNNADSTINAEKRRNHYKSVFYDENLIMKH